MEEDRLLIITKLKKTYEYILKSLENYPHKYLEFKRHIDNTMLEMIELCYIANNGYEKEKNQKSAHQTNSKGTDRRLEKVSCGKSVPDPDDWICVRNVCCK